MEKEKTTLRPLHGLTNLYIVLLFTLFLFGTGSDGYAAIQQAKTALFYRLSGGYLLLLLLLTAEEWLIGKLRPADLKALAAKIGLPQKLVLLYWGLTVISTLLSEYRSAAVLGMSRDEGLLTISLYCAVFLCVSVLAQPGRWLGRVIGGSMTVFSIFCLVQMAGHDPLDLFPEGLTYWDANIKFAGAYLGTTGNAGLTAAVLCMTFPVLLGLAILGKDQWRWLYLIPAGLVLYVLVRSEIEAGLLGVALGMVLSLPVFLPRGSRWRRYAAALIALCLLAGLAYIYFFPAEYGTLREVNRILHGEWNPNFGNGRVLIWQNVLKKVPEHLWFGTGPDTMAAYGIEGLWWQPADGSVHVDMGIDTAHNEYLNILFHQGLPALLAYLAALLVSAIRWVKSRDPMAVACGAGVLCYSIQACFGISMHIAAAFFWVLWALLINRWDM